MRSGSSLHQLAEQATDAHHRARDGAAAPAPPDPGREHTRQRPHRAEGLRVVAGEGPVVARAEPEADRSSATMMPVAEEPVGVGADQEPGDRRDDEGGRHQADASHGRPPSSSSRDTTSTIAIHAHASHRNAAMPVSNPRTSASSRSAAIDQHGTRDVRAPDRPRSSIGDLGTTRASAIDLAYSPRMGGQGSEGP